VIEASPLGYWLAVTVDNLLPFTSGDALAGRACQAGTDWHHQLLAAAGDTAGARAADATRRQLTERHPPDT
jgi:hypothetical protein